jgi:C1A family cysteine protease
MTKVTVIELIRVLQHHGAAIVTFECFESAKTAPEGHITPPDPTEKKLGEHAVALYDHSPEEQRFYFRNSWGQNWGLRGHGSLSYDFIERGHLTKLTVLG